jgi:hypothetical protein
MPLQLVPTPQQLAATPDVHDCWRPIGHTSKQVGFWLAPLDLGLAFDAMFDQHFFDLRRSPPPHPAMTTAAVVGELQEHLLAKEEQLTLREEAIAIWEKGVGVSERALGKVRLELNMERVETKATRHEYLEKMCVHTACVKHMLNLDEMLGEKKVLLSEKDRDLEVWEAALVEAQARGLNPQDNQDKLSELVKLPERLGKAEVARVTEAEELAALVEEISKVLVDHGLPPIHGIP